MALATDHQRPQLILQKVFTVLKGYGFLWTAALGGFLGANALGAAALLFVGPEKEASAIQSWTHFGWYAGTVFFFVAAVLGRLKFINGASASQPAATPPDTRNDSEAHSSSESKKDNSVPGFLFACGLGGGFLGALFGCSLMVFVFSWVYSPFASQQAASSVTVERERTGTEAQPRPVFRYNSATAGYVCLTPAILGIVGACWAAPSLL